jgi:serpin B
MRQDFRQLALVAALACLTACGDTIGPLTELPRHLTAAEQNLIAADNRFAFKLLREIAQQEPEEQNLFISPLSVGMALGMTYNGAAGETREAMRQTLELEGMSIQEVNESYRSVIDLLRGLDPRVEFVLANSVWYRQGTAVVPEFLDVNRQYYDAEVAALDFGDPAAAQTINAWVADQTQGKIADIVTPPIDPLTIMFLINAIYFKGDWTHQFDEGLTRDGVFHLADGSQTMVRMMASEGEIPVRQGHHEGVVVLELAYGGQAYSMTIVAPWDPSDITSLTEGLTQEQWRFWLEGLDSTTTHVMLPKFTLEYEIGLKSVLTALGMGVAFDELEADFSNLATDPPRPYITAVKHKAYVDVNEEGTEAAAVTSVEVGVVSIRLTAIDRPFLFAIRERLSGTILFVGRVMDPSAS